MATNEELIALGKKALVAKEKAAKNDLIHRRAVKELIAKHQVEFDQILARLKG